MAKHRSRQQGGNGDINRLDAKCPKSQAYMMLIDQEILPSPSVAAIRVPQGTVELT